MDFKKRIPLNKRFIVAGNWKMNCNLLETIQLIESFSASLNSSGIKPGTVLSNDNTLPEMIVFPPSTNISVAAQLLKDSGVKVGAQNFYHMDKGAYTGEISADMIKSCGAEFVLVGHSERREIFKESDKLLNQKILSAQKQGLQPVFCCGETLRDRENQKTFSLIRRQLRDGLVKTDPSNMVVAYEPIWAIGTGKTATPEQAASVHQFISEELTRMFGEKGTLIPILYGGSVNAGNADQLFACPEINGALIGGASLKGEGFFSIYKSALKMKMKNSEQAS